MASPSRTKLERTLRWIARGSSLVSVGLLALFVVGDPPLPGSVAARDWVGLAFFPLGVVLGMFVAWRREGLGATVGLTSLLSFYLVYGLVLRGSAALGPWFVVFSSPLLAFALSAAVSKRHATDLSPAWPGVDRG